MKARLLAAMVWVFAAAAAAPAQTVDDLFDPGTVHRLDLLVNTRDWEKLKANFQTNDYYPADVRWNGLTVRNIGIRVRGLSTRSDTKPALRVDMNRYTTGQEFLGLKSFLLDNLLTDSTGIRERVAMKLYQRMGLPAPRESHVTLYVNNTYAGLYGIVESIDKDFLARVFGEQNGDTENDGFLFEYSWVDPWRWDYLGAGLEAYATRFDPTTHEDASMTSLYAPIEAMVRAINESTAENFLDQVGPYLDLPLLMKHLAVQNFIAEGDGILGHNGTANFHFYRFEGGSTRSQFIAWDEDRAFETPSWPIDNFFGDYVLMRRAMDTSSLRAEYFNSLLEVTASAMEGGWLEQEIAAARAQVTSAMLSDPVKPYSNADFEAASNALAAFPSQRAAFVRCEVAKVTGGDAAAACAGQ